MGVGSTKIRRSPQDPLMNGRLTPSCGELGGTFRRERLLPADLGAEAGTLTPTPAGRAVGGPGAGGRSSVGSGVRLWQGRQRMLGRPQCHADRGAGCLVG